MEPPLPPPPDAPPPPLAPAVRRVGFRGAARAAASFGGGRISLYGPTATSAPRFEAQCGDWENHGKQCRLTRAALGFKVEGRREAQVRPLGLLAAWLAGTGACGSKEAHESLVAFLTREDRVEQRNKLLESADGRAVAEGERPLRAGEPDEPLGMP